MPFTTEDFPGRSFEDFEEYQQAKKDRKKILRDLKDPKSITVEAQVEEEQEER